MYAQHVSKRSTPQTEKAKPNQVLNSAGGYTFQIDKWKRLERFLILGSEGGTYYATEKALTKENAGCVVDCANEDPIKTVCIITDVSVKGQAPKNDPAVFALALCCTANAKAKAAALANLQKVCRIGTHLFQFVQACRELEVGGRSLRTAITNWYTDLPNDKLCYQLTKYQQRNGMSHRDVFRLSHPKIGNNAIARWVIGGKDALGARAVLPKDKNMDRAKVFEAVGKLPEYLEAFEELKTANVKRTIELIDKHRFTHEMIGDHNRNSPEVWEALSTKMPITATIRNLGKMTSLGVIKPLSSTVSNIISKLSDVEELKRGRVHPINILSALRVYAQGHGDKGSLKWSPVPQVIDALNDAFYLSFDTIEPSGKRILLALDVSGSMGEACAGIQGLSCREVSAALAMATAKVEKNWHIVGFTSTNSYDGDTLLTELKISPKQRLDDVVKEVYKQNFGRTDCSLPMLYAMRNNLEVDVFHVYTDNETYAGTPHPFQALKQYRNQSGIPAKLAVLAMTATDFSIADPSDSGMLDLVGASTATPNLLAQFASMG